MADLDLTRCEVHISTDGVSCFTCKAQWPCSAALLLAEVRRLMDALKVQTEMHNVCLEIHTESESCLEAEEKLTALRQSNARLLAAIKARGLLVCCCGTAQCVELRAAVAEAEAICGG